MRTLGTCVLTGLAFLLWVGAALAVRADLVSVKDLLAEPDRWHGRSVGVAGSVGRLEARTSQRGNPYYTFVLSDGDARVTVFSYGAPEVRNGHRVRVEGTFLKVERVGQYTFHSQVDAQRITTL
jgi:hypothetical protein